LKRALNKAGLKLFHFSIIFFLNSTLTLIIAHIHLKEFKFIKSMKNTGVMNDINDGMLKHSQQQNLPLSGM